MQGGVFLKNKVEQLRKERGLNQDDFAKMLRVSRQTISSIETEIGRASCRERV